MKYEHIHSKLPPAFKQSMERQSWVQDFVREGVSVHVLLTEAKFLERLLQSMTRAETNTLRLILGAFGCEPFTGQALEKEAGKRMSGAEIHAGLAGLRKHGVIAAFRKAWGEKLFVLPEDGFAAWQTLLFPDIRIRTLPEEREAELEALAPAAACPRGLAQQFFHFMANCSRQDGLPLTSKGTLHKKQLQKLIGHPDLGGAILRGTGLAYAYKDVYDPFTAVMLELAIRLDVLGTAPAGLAIRHKALTDWLALPYETQESILYSHWRELYVPAPAWLQHGIALMDKADNFHWRSLDDIAAEIGRCSGPQHSANKEQIRSALLEQWVEPLRLFGWLELAADAIGMLWFRPLIHLHASTGTSNAKGTGSGERKAQFYVQPDFELLLPPDVPLLTEWEVAAFADLQSSDTVRVYKVTKESFLRASGKGGSAERIIGFLRQHAYFEVPEHVAVTLTQWEQQVGKLYFEEALLLRCQSAEIAESIGSNEKCKPYLLEQIGARDFIVGREHLPLIRKTIEQIGYNPKKMQPAPAQRAAFEDMEPDAAGPTAEAPKPEGIFYSRDSIRLYEIDSSLPDWEELYPDLQDVPARWLKEFGTYHGSTRKEMIRKAIGWKSFVKLRQEGRDRIIVPQALHEDRSGWTLVGVEEQREIQLSGDGWEQMKIILPGINDEEKEESL